MERKQKNSSKPRFSYVRQKAYEFLLEFGFQKFPISPFDVLNQYSDSIICIPWSKAKEIFKIDDPLHLKLLHADGRTLYVRNRFVIAYDDVSYLNENRIKWTLIHEIGHILLGHFRDLEQGTLNKGDLSENEYHIFEIEANFFADEFLMPTPILRYLKNLTIDEICLLFGVSKTAATHKYEKLCNYPNLPETIYDSSLIRNFYAFLKNNLIDTFYQRFYSLSPNLKLNVYNVRLCRKCPNCYTYITNKNAFYCPNCGAKIKQKYNDSDSKSNRKQIFIKNTGRMHWTPPHRETSINGNPIQKLLFCPICLNTEISSKANFCLICGHPLTNYCSTEHIPIALNECYCPSCGSPGTMRDHYTSMVNRRNLFYTTDIFCSDADDYEEYPYWDYLLMVLCSDNKHIKLNAALSIAKAYLNDDDNIIVFTDNEYAASIIHENKMLILDCAFKVDNVRHRELEVYVKNDI